MIQVENHKGTYAPRCVCDVCGKPITDAFDAVVLYPDDGDGPGDGETVRTVYAHKGGCDRRATAAYGDGGGSMELAVQLAFLLKNTGLTGDKLARAIGIAEAMGEM